jgi:hypothetical protein
MRATYSAHLILREYDQRDDNWWIVQHIRTFVIQLLYSILGERSGLTAIRNDRQNYLAVFVFFALSYISLNFTNVLLECYNKTCL